MPPQTNSRHNKSITYRLMRCIIVDDEPLARLLLENYAKRIEDLKVMGSFQSAPQAAAYLQKNSVDLIFLDIQMPGMNGMDFAREISEKSNRGEMRVIFTTAFGEYAIEGFKVDALDYLQKPISFTQFHSAVEHARRWYEREKMEDLFVKDGAQRIRLDIRHLLWAEGEKDYISLHYDNQARTPMILMNMKDLEASLPTAHFMRIHRSYIVRAEAITRYSAQKVWIGEQSFPVSDTYKNRVQEYIKTRMA